MEQLSGFSYIGICMAVKWICIFPQGGTQTFDDSLALTSPKSQVQTAQTVEKVAWSKQQLEMCQMPQAEAVGLQQ